MKKISYGIKVSILLILTIFLVAYLAILDYPRIVRSAYYKNPFYTFMAFYNEFLAKKNFSKAEALKKVRKLNLEPTGRVRFLYLLHKPSPKVDKPIFKRYFQIVTKYSIKTNAVSFWEIPVKTGFAFVEVDSGRVIYLQQDANNDYLIKPKYFN